MQKFWYGDIALHDLGELQIIGQAGVKEPPEAPQRERRTVRVRLNVWNQNYANNAGQINQVFTALLTQQAVLKWEDPNGTDYVNRTVTVSDAAQPERENAQGTYRQSIVFSFWYYIHNLTTSCLSATMTPSAGSPIILGTVTLWNEELTTELFAPDRDARKRVVGTLAASGRFQGDTTQDLETRREVLLGLKDQMIAALTAGVSAQFSYGSFDNQVRVASFKAVVNQPMNYIDWSFSATYTAYPDETNYYWLEYTVGSKTVLSEGINVITLNGKLGATSADIAKARLLLLYTGTNSIIPSGYVQTINEAIARNVESKGGTTAVEAAFIELMFTLEFRDITTIPLTFQSGGSGAPISLGTVEGFTDEYDVQLFDEMKTDRKYGGGRTTAKGKIFRPDSESLTDKRTALEAIKASLDNMMIPNNFGTLVYGDAYSRTVRVIDWMCAYNRFMNCLEWSLNCSYVKFPDPTNYAICDFNFTPSQNYLEGTQIYTLAGRIAASSVEAAYSKLAALRSSLIPNNFVQTGSDPTERRVKTQSGAVDPSPTFIELTFNDKWQSVTGNVLHWDLRITNSDVVQGDVKSGFIQVKYSGTIVAVGATFDAAYATAEALARSLGDNQFGFKINESITANEKLFQTTGPYVFLPVDFSFDYQRKSNATFIELHAERAVDTFGMTTETVRGFINAPDLTTAMAAYLNEVRGIGFYQGLLLLSERTPEISKQMLNDESQDDRFDFSFTVQIAKLPSQTAIEYFLEPTANMVKLEKITVVRGTIQAADPVTANNFLNAFLSTLSLGQQTASSRPEHHRKGGTVGTDNTKVDVFVGLDFTETFADRLTGEDGVLECEVVSSIQYSGVRWVSMPVPTGPDVIQNGGMKQGGQTVTGHVTGTTEIACINWANKMRSSLLTPSGLSDGGPYENPPQISITRRWAPRVDGNATGDSVDVQIYEAEFTFSQIFPQKPFTP